MIGPKALPFLRIMFYVLALVQFAFFAGLEIKGSTNEWIFIGVTSAVLISLLTVHHRFLTRRRESDEEQRRSARKSMYIKKETMETMEEGSSEPDQMSSDPEEDGSFTESIPEHGETFP